VKQRKRGEGRYFGIPNLFGGDLRRRGKKIALLQGKKVGFGD